jgi:hypothetical protein
MEFMMRSKRMVLRVVCSLALAWGLGLAAIGCDSGSSQATQTKPIEGNILKKLSQANAAQGREADAKKPSRIKKQ